MKLTRLFAITAPLALVSAAQAHILVYTAALNGASESPANASPATGTATVTLDLDLATMRVEASFSGLTGTTTASHIHGPTASAGLGNAGVMTTTPSFPGFPLGVTSGTYDHTFDLAQSGTYNPSFVTAQGSISNAMNTLIAAFADGKAYLNIHTNSFPGGEIRGFLTAAVPEPSSYAAFAGLAVAGFVAMRRRR